MNIYITDFGTYVHKKGERLLVTYRKSKKEFPLIKINSIVIEAKGVSISCDLIRELKDRNILIIFTNFDNPFAYIDYFYERNGSIIRKQIEMSEATKLNIVKKIIISKINNQKNVIKSLNKTKLLSSNLKQFDNNIQEIKLVKLNKDWRNKIFAYEANSASIYWNNLASVLNRYEFYGRSKRGARDVVNSCLNYSYAILASKVLRYLLLCGVSPHFSLLHSESIGNSLVYDLIEPFRPFVDRQIITLFTKKIFNREFDFDSNKYLLTKTGKEKVIDKVSFLFNKKFNVENRFFEFENIIKYQISIFRDFLLDKKRFKILKIS